jgi:hypothetical protein
MIGFGHVRRWGNKTKLDKSLRREGRKKESWMNMVRYLTDLKELIPWNAAYIPIGCKKKQFKTIAAVWFTSRDYNASRNRFDLSLTQNFQQDKDELSARRRSQGGQLNPRRIR